MEDFRVGDWFLCTKDARMELTKELVYRKGEFYKCEEEGCITNLYGNKQHHWNSSEAGLERFFKKVWSHKRRTKLCH